MWNEVEEVIKEVIKMWNGEEISSEEVENCINEMSDVFEEDAEKEKFWKLYEKCWFQNMN